MGLGCGSTVAGGRRRRSRHRLDSDRPGGPPGDRRWSVDLADTGDDARDARTGADVDAGNTPFPDAVEACRDQQPVAAAHRAGHRDLDTGAHLVGDGRFGDSVVHGFDGPDPDRDTRGRVERSARRRRGRERVPVRARRERGPGPGDLRRGDAVVPRRNRRLTPDGTGVPAPYVPAPRVCSDRYGTTVSDQNQSSSGGRAATIVLLVLQAGSVLVFGGFGLFIAFISDSCGSSSTCDTNRIALGMMTPLAVSVVLFVVSLVHAIARMRGGRSAWWVPILWTFLSAFGIVIGFMVAASGVSSNGSLV